MKYIYKAKGKKRHVIKDLRDLVQSSAELYGEQTLYVYKETQETLRYSYARLWDEMNSIGTALAKFDLLGCGVVVTGNTNPHYVTAYLTAVNGGGYIVPLDNELSAEQTFNFIERSEAQVIFYTDSQNSKIAQIAPQLKNIKLFVPINPGEDYKFAENVIPIEELIAMGKAELEAGNTTYTKHEIDMNKMSAILFTSGTTGTSKGVMLSQNNLTAAINATVQTMPFEDDIRSISILPVHHAYEMTCEHLSAMVIGGEMYINDNIKHIKRTLSEFKPTILVVVPLFVETMYKRIWVEARKKGMDKKLKFGLALSNFLLRFKIDIRKKLFSDVTAAFGGDVKLVVCGGAPIDPELVKNFYALGIVILEGYGITECAPLVAVNLPSKIKLGSVGQPVMGCTVKIDTESPDADGDTGEILVKGENVMLGYFKDPEATSEVFTEDGWFRTGDFGYVDKQGYVFITGRKKNIIITSNGKNVYPEELEEYIDKIELVEESVVIERKKEGAPIIVAIIVPNEELTEGMTDDEIYKKIKAEVDRINNGLPPHKFIYDIEIRHEKFERNTTLKIIRYKVQ
ncbi:MAG TPA: AMP-binding protein [Clostridia bacterium]|nr:AMP-binding protein [Clostridia bacterium]